MSVLKPIFHDYAWPIPASTFEKYATLGEALNDLFVGELNTDRTRDAIQAFCVEWTCYHAQKERHSR